MSSIPLPALSIRPAPQPANPLAEAAQVIQLKNLLAQQALIPGQQQLQQQQIAAQNLALEKGQLGLQSKQALQQTIQNWNPSKDSIADFPKVATANGVLPQDIKPFIDLQTSMNQAGQTSLNFQKAKQGAITEKLAGVLALPDDQLAPGSMQALKDLSSMGAIDPQTATQIEQHLQSVAGNPAALRQQLQQFENVQGLHSQMLDYSLKQQQLSASQAAQGASEANAAHLKAETNLLNQYGGTNGQMQFVHDYLEANNLPNTPKNRLKADNAYNVAKAQGSFGAFYSQRVDNYYDPKTHEIVRGTMIGPPPGHPDAVKAGDAIVTQALTSRGLLNDMAFATDKAEEALGQLKKPFSATQAAQIALALRNPDGAAASAALQKINSQLTPEQQDYVIQLTALRESVMSLRKLLGGGRMFEQQMRAITSSLPGPQTPNGRYARMQLQRLRETMGGIEVGIPHFAGQGDIVPQVGPGVQRGTGLPAGAIPGTLNGRHGYVLNGVFHADAK